MSAVANGPGPEVFDVVVIGAGPAGEVVAGRAAEAGLSVAVVERERVGGECSYWGCIPSKTLLRPGDVIAAARRVPGAASAVTGEIDTPAAFARRDEMVGGYSDEGAVPWLLDRGVTLVRGRGRLAGPLRVDVDTADAIQPDAGTPAGTTRRLAARKAVVLATGTKAFMPPIPGLADVEPWDNRSATGATLVPRRLVVLGGGAVGTELAQGFRRLGTAEVTIIEGQPRLLAREEPFAGDEVGAAFEAEGIAVRTGCRVTAVRRGDDGAAPGPASSERRRPPVVVTLDNGDELTADEILVAVGRRPATEDLGLETVGLTPGRPVTVDSSLRAVGATPATGGSGEADGDGWLYAIGDVNGRALLTHMGKYQGRLVADLVAGRRDAAGAVPVEVAGERLIPRVTFTDPQVAAVGLTEQAAREAGLPVRAVSVPTSGVAGSSVRGVGLVGTSQLVVDEERRVLVGATFTGQDVQELLHSATIAIVGEVPLERLWHAVPSFPTVSEVWLRLLETYGL
ncbi:dihydrolipoyl dehydrogenase family protein [Pseudofrankia inefficax]|uniref:FAD-dependent pyridine nucleotide-disulfide oxidoreductase n=1 Tax=Pseudofrankia inefficax (strain DSM 45817 / CECT 9037 / DDB 130130 / EuI1c) TaxID=298654 RepID=E3J2C9_PSEI1|nr:NAD(P)/FAD-dependent oxidoreductase [Pseudofrankia inefficax]ADP79301.1 FAD-dependent pyridine nucleotide-disulfide oxidoreductase [Pseudofrankia inefficax]